MSKRAMIIDGHSIINRAFYAMPDLTNAEGVHTGAVYGFLNMLFKFLEDEAPDRLVVSFDTHAPTFRHKMYSEYKATRHKMPEELTQQVPVLRETLEDMNITCINLEGYESDDIMGTLAGQYEKAGYDVSVISGDRDLLQLATDKTCIKIIKTTKTGTETLNYHADDVMSEYGVSPTAFIDIKALMGDSSDNIPGVPGVGLKTAQKLIQDYGSIEGLYSHTDELKGKLKEKIEDNKESAEFSKVLSTIDTNVPLDLDIEAAFIGDMFNEKAYERFKWLGFKRLLSKFDETEVKGPALPEIRVIEDLNTLEDIFASASGAACAGVHYMEVCGSGLWALSLDDEATYIVYEEGLLYPGIVAEHLKKLADGGSLIAAVDIKSQIEEGSREIFNIEGYRSLFDCSLASYLLDPINSEHGYDLLSGSYLGAVLPSYKEVFKKDAPSEVFEKDRSTVYGFAGMNSRTALKTCPILADNLKNDGLFDLFYDIEMQLLFVLKAMEEKGMRADRTRLQEYGKSLQARIAELEQLIYD
ncbi:MAG: DNA polymerase I, partial [Lachnospiraceae bacterium]|nr:DNA polymerase I [Lachnospiraceae bacterium]